MSARRRCVVPILFCASLLPCQGPPQPAEQLARFSPMLGTWEGSGIVRPGPAGPEFAWTARSATRRVLGGHFLREDVRIDMPTMPRPLQKVGIYGWDRERERFVSVVVGNTGQAVLQELQWLADDKMVAITQSYDGDVPVVDRLVSEFHDDAVEFTVQRAAGDGPFFEHIRGEMRRTSAEPEDVDTVDAAFVPQMVTLAKDRLARLAPALGDYRVEGWWRPAPDADKLTVTGTEQLRAVFGGALIEMRSRGEAGDGAPGYEALSWIGWDDHERCYLLVHANNMGEIGAVPCRLVDGNLIGTTTELRQGQPVCIRGVTEIGERGLLRHTGHEMRGAAAPVQVFAATYEKLSSR